MTAYPDDARPFPYCPGCGHPHVLASLQAALSSLGTPPERAAIVTDTGCAGLADPCFPATHTIHTLHARSVAIAAGLRMGDGAEEAEAPPLKPIVLIGDGGAGSGLLHLIHAAQINVDVTVIVHNNLVLGMIGGRSSMLTPQGMATASTPAGSPYPALDLDPILGGAGAGFFARAFATGEDLPGILARAIEHPGFACVEVLALCPTFATLKAGVTSATLRDLPARAGLRMGIVRCDASRPSLPGLRAAAGAARGAARAYGASGSPGDGIVPDPSLRRLDRAARCVVAGRAGEEVSSSALLAASAACAAGLRAVVRTDAAVTPGHGFALAELTVSPDPIGYTGMIGPDFALALAQEGIDELASRGVLRPPLGARRLVCDDEVTPPRGCLVRHEALRRRHGPAGAALGGLVGEIDRAGWWDRRAWVAAFERLPAARRAEAETVLGSLA